MTVPKQSPMTRDDVIGLRGLRLPAPGLKALQRAGIYCQPAISIEFQQASQQYLIRGVESGGAVPRIGAYCGFLDSSSGSPTTTHPVNAIGVNGLHAALLSVALSRIQMFRSETAYELLITAHRLSQSKTSNAPVFTTRFCFMAGTARLIWNCGGRMSISAEW